MGMKVGYARVSTIGQKLDVQLDYLADCDRVFREKASASSTKNRPELKEVQEITESWVTEYNEERPHDSLGNLTPKEYLAVNQ